VKYTATFQAAQDEARAAGRGIWGGAADCPLEIVSINYDAPGNDNDNLNEEYVTFRALVSGPLLGYAVEDETGHRYEFPDRLFQKGQVFKLHTGKGTDTQTDLYWGMVGSAVWNNNGDTVKVLDPQGHIVASRTY
jgi:micrococcal nuclease